MKTIIFFFIMLLEMLFIKVVFSQDMATFSNLYIFDYDPDIELDSPGSDTLKIDLDNDSINDVLFCLSSSSAGNWAYIQTLHSDCNVSYISYYPTDSLSGNTLRWHSGKINFLGEFDNQEKIGIRIYKNNAFFYGWIRAYFVSSQFNRNLYIDKYAFCPIPDYPLLWGQTILTNVNDIGTAPVAWAYYDPVVDQLSIHAVKKIKLAKLLTSNGIVVSALRNVNACMAVFNTSGLPAGAYLVRLTFYDESFYTLRVLLE